MEAEEADLRDFSELPISVLVSIFDNVLTAATAHPMYLPHKTRSYAVLSCVCKSWNAALQECPIGVCLPARVDANTRRWLTKVLLRGIEFHDPEHTDPEVVAILSHPGTIARSGKSIQSIVDAPFDGTWRPADYPNVVQLVVWRAGQASSIWNARCIRSLHQLTYLVLAAGFTGMRNLNAWPPSCKRLVWTCPSDSHSSRLSVPRFPPSMALQWVSLRAYAVRLRDPESLLEHVAELMVHAAYIYIHVPRHWYPSLVPPALLRQLGGGGAGRAGGDRRALSPGEGGSSDASSSPSRQPQQQQEGTAGGAGEAGAGPGPSSQASAARAAAVGAVRSAPRGRARRLSGDWVTEGLTALSDAWVRDPCMLSLRLKFARLLISQPLSGRLEGANDDSCSPRPGSQSPGPHGSDGGSEEEGRGGEGEAGAAGVAGASAAAAAGGQHEGCASTSVCRNCGRKKVTHRRPKRPKAPGGGGDGDGSGTSGGEEEEDDSDDELMYDEVTPDQVTASLTAAIERYRQDAPSLAHPVRSTATAATSGGPSTSERSTGPKSAATPQGFLFLGKQSPYSFHMPVPSQPNFPGAVVAPTGLLELGHIVPQLTTGKVYPGQDREITISRKHGDPSEPARIKLDQPQGAHGGGLSLVTELPKLARRPIQSLAFAPWPYPADLLDGLEAALEGLIDDQAAGVQLPAPAVATTPDSPTQGQQGEQGPQGTSEPAPQIESSPVLLPPVESARLQHQLLADPRFLATSADHLRKINHLLLPPPPIVLSKPLRSLLVPFVALTKLSLVTLGQGGDEVCDMEPFLPVSVVKVTIYAGGPNQRFRAKFLSNLTEIWRLQLVGFSSWDISDLPVVRPGVVLKVVDTPATRRTPLGKQGVDVLTPPGYLQQMNIHMGTDKSLSEPGLSLTRVDILPLAKVARDLHIRSPRGVEIHADTASIAGLFRQLSQSRIEQFTVGIAIGPSGDISAGGGAAWDRNQGSPVFAFVLKGGIMRVHGVHIAMLVKQGAMPGWSVEIMDAGVVEDEEGILFFTFYKTPPEEVADAGVQASFSGGAGTSSETANGLSPSGSGSMSSAEIAQLQLAALTLAFSTAGEGGDVVGSSGSLAGDVEPSLLDDLD